MNNDNFLIENSDLDIVREFCACINDSNKRSCAVSNKLAAEIAKKYFTEIELDPVTSLHEIPQVLEKIEVSDIYIKNNYIDVRLYFEDEPLFIPKSHFDNNMLPLAYMFIMVNKELSGATVTGFMLTSDIEANFTGDYLQVSEDDLISYYDLENNLVLNNVEDIDEDFEVSIHNYLDDKLSDTAEFYNLLIQSPEARTKLKNAAKAKEIIKFISIADCESTLDSEANAENTEQNFEDTELDAQDDILESNETIDLQVSDSDDGLISLEPVSDISFEELNIQEDVDMLENPEMASDFILEEDNNEAIIEDLTISEVQEEYEVLSEPVELSIVEEQEAENSVTEYVENDMQYSLPADDSTDDLLNVDNEPSIVELADSTESLNETSEDFLLEDNYLVEEETASTSNYEKIENNVEDSEEIVDENIIIQEEADAVQELVLDNNEIVEDNISETIPEEENPYVTNTTPSLTSIEDFDEDELMKDLEQIIEPSNEEVINNETASNSEIVSPEIDKLFQDNNIDNSSNNNDEYYEPIQTQHKSSPLKFIAILALLTSLGYFGYSKFVNNNQAKDYTTNPKPAVTKTTNTKKDEAQKPVAMPNETVENTKVEQTNEGIVTETISSIEKNLDTSILVSNLAIKWEVPASYVSSGTAKRYFTKLGKILQLNLKTELLLLTKMPITNKICVELEFDKTKQKFGVKNVTASSGDKNIDAVIVSTINNALNINLNMNMSIFENITGNPVLVINL